MNALHFKSRTIRHPIVLEATVRRADGSTRVVAVEDFSIGGCCLQGYFEIGERLVVELPRVGTLRAQVRWAVLGKAGIRFERNADL